MRPARGLGCRWLAASLAVVLVLGGCASAPKVSAEAAARRARAVSPGERDGPGANPPANVASLADAEPRLERVRSGGPNKPYQVFGRDYVPQTSDAPFAERGLASWYGRKFHGAPTASGEPYDMYAMTAAHPTLPIPSYARIANPANGREVIVRINDRGPFHSGRVVDLSYAAAARLDLLRGVAPVELERITDEQIRVGSWRRKNDPGAVPTVVAAAALPTAPATPPEAVREADPLAAARAPAPAPASPRPSAATAPGFWVQLGAFRDGSGAEVFQRRVAADVEGLAASLATFSEASLYRVQAGPFADRDEAQQAAQRIREVLGLVPMVVERK